MALPPGIPYLLTRISKLLLSPVLLTSLYALSSRIYPSSIPAFSSIPTWLLVLCMIVSLPVTFFVKLQVEQWRQRRECKRLGAIMVPEVPSKWPAGLDLLKRMLFSFKHGYPGDIYTDISSTLGTAISVRIIYETRIITTEPAHIKAMLATSFPSFEKGEKFQHQAQSVLGTGVFNSDGEMWKFHRTMTRPFFSRDRISHFDIFERHAEEVVRLMKERGRVGGAVDMQDAMSRFTLDSATEFLFGSCVHSLSAGLPYPPSSTNSLDKNNNDHPANIFARAFQDSQDIIALRSRFGEAWPLFEFWEDRTKRPMGVINKFIEPIVEEAVRRKREGRDGEVEKGGEGDEETLLDHLVNYTEDPTILKDETLNIMIAGRDTTAATLTFLVYALCLHPEVLAKLRSEVLAKVGPTQRPTYDDLRDMKYLRAVINEVLRLFPPVPFNMRSSVTATTWDNPKDPSKPFYIPAGTKCPYSVFLMHRRTDLWGPDALEFDPERFLDERVHKYLTPNPFIFLPFNAGPRICLGQQFAYNESAFMAVKLVQHFDRFELAGDAQPEESKPPKEWKMAGGRKAREQFFPKSHLTMYSNGGLWVRMREAAPVETV
ncbi:cytochrome P450 [Rickenella mellea]|uniref:Cytochrome P450 n=1 Tax=Rickenella mellea TaxID=50990 RepID=A0A4Y7PJT1_9AGAM|nr:cytochrome P450 [Rickenella mellea]